MTRPPEVLPLQGTGSKLPGAMPFATDPGKLATLGASGKATEGDIPKADYTPIPSAFHIRGRIGPQTVSFVADTGAAVNLLRKDYADRVTNSQTPLSVPEKTLVSVNGSLLKLHGCATLLVDFGGCKSEVRFTIAESLTVEAILGLEFLVTHHGTLNFRAGVLTLPDVTIPLAPVAAQRIETMPVSLAEDLHIPPSCELEIMGHVPSALCGDYLLEQTAQKCLSVRVARALVSTTEKGVPLRLINPSTQMVILHKGTQLAVLEPIESQAIHQIRERKSPSSKTYPGESWTSSPA